MCEPQPLGRLFSTHCPWSDSVICSEKPVQYSSSSLGWMTSTTSGHNESPTPVTVFWDIENCCVPSGMRGYHVVAAIRKLALQNGRLMQTRAIGNLKALSEQLRGELHSSAVVLQDVSLGKPGAADIAILVELLKLVCSNKPPHCIILISGDRDFSTVLNVLVEQGYKVILIHLPQASDVLKNAATESYLWTHVLTNFMKSPNAPLTLSTSRNPPSSPVYVPTPLFASKSLANGNGNPVNISNSNNSSVPMINNINLVKFQPLMNLLVQLGGETKAVLFSTIGNNITYQERKQYGFKSLRDYVKEAHRHGLVNYGGNPPQEWVSLCANPVLPGNPSPKPPQTATQFQQPPLQSQPQSQPLPQLITQTMPQPPALSLPPPAQGQVPQPQPPLSPNSQSPPQSILTINLASSPTGSPPGSPRSAVTTRPPSPSPSSPTATAMPQSTAATTTAATTTAATTSPTLSPVTASTATGVNSLVQALVDLLKNEPTKQVLLGNIAERLSISYRDFGYDRFKDFILDACSSGAVIIGGEPTAEWVSLPPGGASLDAAAAQINSLNKFNMNYKTPLMVVLDSLKKDSFKPTEKLVWARLKLALKKHKSDHFGDWLFDEILADALKCGFTVVGTKPNRFVYSPESPPPANDSDDGVDPSTPNHERFDGVLWAKIYAYFKANHPINKKGRYGFAEYLKANGPAELRSYPLGIVTEQVQVAIDKKYLLISGKQVYTSPKLFGKDKDDENNQDLESTVNNQFKNLNIDSAQPQPSGPQLQPQPSQASHPDPVLVPVEFVWTGGGNVILVTGSFCDWKVYTPLQWIPSRGYHSITINVSPGVYHYKYVVDGEWTFDASKKIVADSSGNLNNQLVVVE